MTPVPRLQGLAVRGARQGGGIPWAGRRQTRRFRCVNLAVLLAWAISGGVGCSSLQTTLSPDYRREPPAVAAVLPFQTAAEGVGASSILESLRRAFHACLANRRFCVPSLEDVEHRLRRAGFTTPEAVRAADPRLLGKVLDADAVLLGDEIAFSRFHALLVHRRALSGRFRLVSTRTGRTLWEGRVEEADLGGLLLESGQVVAALVHAAEATRGAAWDGLAQAFCRRAAAALPTPERTSLGPAERPSLGPVTVRRTGNEVEVLASGTSGLHGRLEVGSGPERRIIPAAEQSPGVYRGTWRAPAGNAPAPAAVVVRLENRFGVSVAGEAREAAVAVAAHPGRPLAPVASRSPTGAGLEVSWEAPPGAGGAVYVVYRAAAPGSPMVLIRETRERRFLDPQGTPLSAYWIEAVDAAGNRSEPAGPATLEAEATP